LDGAMTDSEFMSAKEKTLVLEQWERFLKNGLKVEWFTGRLYEHLSLHASFIAHFNRQGFFDTYFEDPEATIRFLNQFDGDHGFRSAECGGTWWLKGDYGDINGAMCRVLESYKVPLYMKLKGETRRRDLALAGRLLAKHGIALDSKANEDVRA